VAKMLVRTGAWLAALIITVISIVPGNMQPDVMPDELYEHFVAYFITGSFLAIGYSRPTQLVSSGILLVICAGALEIIQLWIPGRTSSAVDFVTSSFGAWMGLILIGVLRRARDGMAAPAVLK
jgi:VanZ family protein